LQEKLQGKYTGGAVFHTYMGERISNAESCKQLVKKILTQFRIPYVTITPTFSICPKHGYLEGEHDYCPKCDAELGLEKAVDTEIREKHDSRRQKTVPKNRQTHSHIS
jgi:anaerobic ribonucleoside-triphosphate reductase